MACGLKVLRVAHRAAHQGVIGCNSKTYTVHCRTLIPYLPKLGTNLITALAALDVYDFCGGWAHGVMHQARVSLCACSTYRAWLLRVVCCLTSRRGMTSNSK